LADREKEASKGTVKVKTAKKPSMEAIKARAKTQTATTEA
jgi:hypothetical protein